MLKKLLPLALLLFTAVAAHAASTTVGGPNPMYEYTLIAKKADVISGLIISTIISPSVALNENGSVAFVARDANGQFIAYAAAGVTPRRVSFTSAPNADTTYGPTIDLNDKEQLVARTNIVGGLTTVFVAPQPSPAFIDQPPLNVGYTPIFESNATVPMLGSSVRLWDTRPGHEGEFISRARANTFFTLTRNIDLAGPGPTINKDGVVMFSQVAMGYQQPFAFIGRSDNDIAAPGALAGPFINGPMYPRIADDATTIVRVQDTEQSFKMMRYAPTGARELAATDATNIALGLKPAISRDAVGALYIVSGTTPGGTELDVYLPEAAADVSGTQKLLGTQWDGAKCAEAELGFDNNGKALCFKSIALDQRVGILHTPFGGGDSYVVSFYGTPNAASRENPVTNAPLLFTDQPGLWTMRFDVLSAFGQITRTLVPHLPLKVVQIGDRIDGTVGNVILGIDANAPLAAAATDLSSGAVRTQRRGDHRIAFAVTTTDGDKVIMASHIDSDEDGLPDHWETAGGGVDMDGDGNPDLDLFSMGARPDKRDLFVQVDWSADRAAGDGAPITMSVKPRAVALQRLAWMFAAAPPLTDTHGYRSDGAPPAVIPAGIVVHMDAGPDVDPEPAVLPNFGTITDSLTTRAVYSYSYNMGHPSNLAGGNEVRDALQNINFTYESFADPYHVGGPTTRSVDEIKRLYLGQNSEKFARELAFRYVYFGQHSSVYCATAAQITTQTNAHLSQVLLEQNTCDDTEDNPGIAVAKIFSGAGIGQVRRIQVDRAPPTTIDISVTASYLPYSTLPAAGSLMLLFSTSSGLSEEDFSLPVTRPGNEAQVTIGDWGPKMEQSPAMQWRTLAHELGHTLGLIHCGTFGADASACQTPPVAGDDHDHVSLMSYRYQTVLTSTVNSYSDDRADMNEWDVLQLGFQDSALSMGNSWMQTANGAPGANSIAAHEPGIRTFMDANGGQLPDVSGPNLSFYQPISPGTALLNAPFVASVVANDPSGVALLRFGFDADGDGVIVDSERITVAAPSTALVAATWPLISGGSITREVQVDGFDGAGNYSFVHSLVVVGAIAPTAVPSPSPTPTATTGPTNTPTATPTPHPTRTPTATPTPTGTPVPGCRGDFTGGLDGLPDGRIRVNDLQYIAFRWDTATGEALFEPRLDLNANGRVDVLDIGLVAQHLNSDCNRPFARAAVTLATRPGAVIAQPTSVQAGEIFTVDVLLDSVSNLGAFDIAVHVDPARMEVSDIAVGPLLAGSGRTFITHGSVSAGSAGIFGYTLGRAGAGASGTGVIARVRVKALVSGAPGVLLGDVMLTTPTGAELAPVRIFLPAVLAD